MREAANKALEEVFSPGELELLRQAGGEALTGKERLSDEELLQLHEAFTETAPLDESFERIVDKFYDSFGI